MEPESPPRVRRSSILKVARPAPARSPLQSLEPNQDAHDEDRTTVTRSFKRRVSFSRTNKVQEFCLENPQTWGEAYEKELSPEPNALCRETIPFEPSGSLQDLLSSEIKTGAPFIRSFSSSSTSEVFRMSYEMSQTSSHHQPPPPVHTATISSSEVATGDDDDMDITAPNVTVPSIIPAPQVKPILEVDKENLVSKLMPDFMQKSLLDRSATSATETTFANVSVNGTKKLSMQAFPNVYLEPDDYDASPEKPMISFSVLDKTRIDDSAMEMSTCSMADENNTGNAINMNKTYGEADKNLLEKSVKFNETMNEACKMDITEPNLSKAQLAMDKSSFLSNTHLKYDATNIAPPQTGLHKNFNGSVQVNASMSFRPDMMSSHNMSVNPNMSSIARSEPEMDVTGGSVSLLQTKPEKSFDTEKENAGMSSRLEDHSILSMNIETRSIFDTPSSPPPYISTDSSGKLNISNTKSQNSFTTSFVKDSQSSLNKTCTDKSMMDISRVLTPDLIQKSFGEKSMMDITRTVTPIDMHKSDCEKSNMDLTRTVSQEELLQKSLYNEKSIMNITGMVSSDDLLSKSLIEDTETNTDELLKDSMMDLTRIVTPDDMQQKSIMNITETVSSDDVLQKSMMDITETNTDELLKKIVLDLPRIVSPDKITRTMSPDVENSINTTTIKYDDILQKSYFEKSMMDITRTISPCESSRTDIQTSETLNKTVPVVMGTTLNEENNPILFTEKTMPQSSTHVIETVTFIDSDDMDMTEISQASDSDKETAILNQSKTDTIASIESENTQTTITITDTTGSTIDKCVNHNITSMRDMVANETCDMESYKIVETRKDATPSEPHSEVQIDKHYITEDVEDVCIDEITGQISHKVKHLEISQTVESHVPIIDTTEPESQGTKIDLNSRQELYLSPVMSDRNIDVATLVTRPQNSSPVLPQRLSFDEDQYTSLSKEMPSYSEIEEDLRGGIKRHSTSFEDEVVSTKKSCQDTVLVPEIILTNSTPTETVTFSMPDSKEKKTETSPLNSKCDETIKNIMFTEVEHQTKSHTADVEKRQLENQNHPEHQQVKKMKPNESQDMKLELTLPKNEKPLQVQAVAKPVPPPQPTKPLTPKEQLAKDIKSMRYVWHVQSVEKREWQLTTLRGAALFTLKLSEDGEVNQASFKLNSSGILSKQKGPQIALKFCYSLLELYYTSERLHDMCLSCDSPLDVVKQLYRHLLSLTTLARSLEQASTCYLLEFSGTRVTFRARSLQLLLKMSVSVNLAHWEDIDMSDVDVTIHNGTIRDLDIVELLPTISRNSDFMNSYIEVVREYVKTLEQCCGNVFNQSIKLGN